ncbi:hypothetical protein KY290_005314 [Solanum tuberosum]|uniref:Uncharacterized protein n=1 Tax=Solanum tuberosum TaxID=4113 RepID=A0ABQ7WDR0_SOLTU|nr:hypothetical protein KY290_005314 [Solanum tuberosum]
MPDDANALPQWAVRKPRTNDDTSNDEHIARLEQQIGDFQGEVERVRNFGKLSISNTPPQEPRTTLISSPVMNSHPINPPPTNQAHAVHIDPSMQCVPPIYVTQARPCATLTPIVDPYELLEKEWKTKEEERDKEMHPKIWHNWSNMAEDFMERFRFNIEIIPDRSYLEKLKKKTTETFREMLLMTCIKFTDLVKTREALEEGIKFGRVTNFAALQETNKAIQSGIIGGQIPPRPRQNFDKRKTYTPLAEPYAQLFEGLKASGVIQTISWKYIKPHPKWFDESKHCAYHSRALKGASPNVNNNHLPNHGNVGVNMVTTDNELSLKGTIMSAGKTILKKIVMHEFKKRGDIFVPNPILHPNLPIVQMLEDILEDDPVEGIKNVFITKDFTETPTI